MEWIFFKFKSFYYLGLFNVFLIYIDLAEFIFDKANNIHPGKNLNVFDL